MTNPAALLTKDLVMGVLEKADKQLSVAEIRARIRTESGIVLHRSTIYTALQRAALHSRAAYAVGDDGMAHWYLLEGVTDASRPVIGTPSDPSEPLPRRVDGAGGR
ncbi:hypothetical protein [Actinoplanes sp. NPDC026623]|uniref:hypothetical protein n=1 Tax=Actinoplanes sp. NPDC026623 TaxID=3155610 RepID=UPI00340E8DAE